MNPTEHVQMVGPWGWIGYGIAAVFAFLLYRLWNSSRVTELRKMGQELERARTTIGEMRRQQAEWKHEKEAMEEQLDTQREKIQALEQSEEDLAANVMTLSAARDVQIEVINRMEQAYARLQDDRDYLYARVVQLEVRQGIEPGNAPWEQKRD